MDQPRDYHSSWSYDSSAPPPPPYHDGTHYNHVGGFSNGGHYNQNRRYQNHYQDVGAEPTDSFGYSNGTAFTGRKRQYSSHGPHDYFDGGSYGKLYVSNVPRDVTEVEIHSLFGEYGKITEVILFNQIKNLQQQGKTDCCFVKFAKTEDADEAIKSLDNLYTFPGRMRPIEVRYASKKQPGPGFLKTHENKFMMHENKFMAHENKVFVGCLNKYASKAEIAEIFSPYGYVEDVFLMLDDQRRSRGTGFISFTDRAMAAAAINGLNGKFVMKGCDQPLIVRFAEPKKPKIWDSRYAPYPGDPVAQNSTNSSYMSSKNGSEPPSVSSTCSVPTCLEADPPDCDWSEHICPDGNAYYYNCVTCESVWEKPEEYSLYEQQLDNCNQQSNSPLQHTHCMS